MMLVLRAVALAVAMAKPISLSTQREMERTVKELPSYAPLSFTGVAFFHGKLYVGSNAGLWVLSGAAPEALLQFGAPDAVVSGPWHDQSGDRLWVQQADDLSLWRFDGKRWASVPFPETALTRGDVLRGFRIVAGRGATWLLGGGRAWRFEASVKSWTLHTPPVSPLAGLLFIGDTTFFLGVPRRSDVLEQYTNRAIAGNADAKNKLDVMLKDPSLFAQPVPVYVSSENGISQVPDKTSTPFVPVKSASTNDAVHLCTERGDVARLTRTEIVSIAAPGRCEGITTDGKGMILASFIGRGIHELIPGGWAIRGPPPLGENPGDHATYMTIDGDQIAYASNRQMPFLKSQGSGTTVLFVGPPQKLVRAIFPGTTR